MARLLFLSLCLLAFPLTGCGTGGLPDSELIDDDDDDDDGVELPEEIPSDWLGGMSGEIINLREYTSGLLADTDCTEVYALNGANVTDIVPEPCPTCDAVFNVFITSNDECAGSSGLGSEGQYGFELLQAEGEAILWTWVDGGWGQEDGWEAFATGTLTRDDELLTLDVELSWADEDNGAEWGGNSTTEDPCGWWSNRCNFDSFFDVAATIEFEILEEETTD
ncbi:MAG: hypothetical protein GY898_07445 [Proteobacteria bacterium]|nr:hypothetical protein [Pseudomonadota bacterium]